MTRVEVAVAFLARSSSCASRTRSRSPAPSPLAPIRISRADAERSLWERPLRLIPTEVTPAAELARTIQTLLVVASCSRSRWSSSRAATEADEVPVQDALEVLAERYAEGQSGIVLEQVAGGSRLPRRRLEARSGVRPPVRKAREKGPFAGGARDARDRRLPRPATRPEVARIRGVNVDGVIAGLVERGLVAEGGRENEFGAIRYRTTPLFERVFGLQPAGRVSPRIDYLGDDVAQIRERLEAVGR